MNARPPAVPGLGDSRAITVAAPAHVAERYVEGVAPFARDPLGEVREALRNPVFTCPNSGGTATLIGCVNARGIRFIALARRRGDTLEVETVGAWWRWHETRTVWRKAGYSKKRGRKPAGQAA